MAYEAEVHALTKIGHDVVEITSSLLQRLTELEARVSLLEGDGLDIPLEHDEALHQAAGAAREEILREEFRG